MLARSTGLTSALVSTLRLSITKYSDTPAIATIKATIRSSGTMDEVLFSNSSSCSNMTASLIFLSRPAATANSISILLPELPAPCDVAHTALWKDHRGVQVWGQVPPAWVLYGIASNCSTREAAQEGREASG